MKALSLVRTAAIVAAVLAGGAQAAYQGRDFRPDYGERQGVVIYSQPNFSGKSVTLNGDATTLVPHGIQDQASSIQVRSGRWEFCSQPNYAGDCVTLASGDYPALEQRLNHRIESVREVDRVVADGRNRDYRWREYADRDRDYDYRERDYGNRDNGYRERGDYNYDYRR
jgi:hypothetical protein